MPFKFPFQSALTVLAMLMLTRNCRESLDAQNTLFSMRLMTNCHTMENMNCGLRQILWSALYFAGIVTLCVEGFWLILPVLIAANRSQIGSIRFKQSRLFTLFKRLKFYEKCDCRFCVATHMKTLTYWSLHHIMLKVGEGKSQAVDKKSVHFLRSVTNMHCVEDMIIRVFSDIW